MVLEFYSKFDLKVVDVDDNIETKVFDDGVLLTFTGEENGLFFPYENGSNTMPVPMRCVLEDEAIPLVKYIVEKYDLLIGAVDNFYKVASRCACFIYCEDEEISDAAIEDYATLEMLAYADVYGWSAEFIAHLKTIRKAAREKLCVKDSYAVGDVVEFNFCDDEMIYSQHGKVIYVDKLHAIVHVTARTKQLMGLNRNSMPHDEVSKIIGQPIETIIKHDYDEFIDMMDPASYLAVSAFASYAWINPNWIFE